MARSERVDFEVTSIAEIVTSPSSKLARARAAEELRAALAELPVEQQLLLELHYWHELDAAALAEVFGVNAGAIRVRLLRARRALGDKLARLDRAAWAGDPLARSLTSDDEEESV
jgi:RNA polymerase sigma-70 factor (ECF subfamily)